MIFVGTLAVAAPVLVLPAVAASGVAPGPSPIEPLQLLGVPIDFILFGLTLAGVAVFHHYTLSVALTGLAIITVYKLAFTGFKFGLGFVGLALHLQHEWVILTNLFLLLMGFALLSRHFEASRVPDEMPAFLPDDWKGGLALLAIVFVMSAFLDNIAAALIGGTMARHVFHGKVHIGYLAAIVAASNAGGSGSVVGDTTTTMMWIDGSTHWRFCRPMWRQGPRCWSSAFRRRVSSRIILPSSASRRSAWRSSGRAWLSSRRSWSSPSSPT